MLCSVMKMIDDESLMTANADCDRGDTFFCLAFPFQLRLFFHSGCT
jgi:hypothetical protein